MFIAAHSHLVALPTTARSIMVVATTGAYIAACIALFPYMGHMALTLVGLPVTVAAWLLGLRAGLVATLLTIPLNTLLLNAAGEPGWDALLRRGNWPGLVSLLVIAIAIGRLHDLQERARGISDRLGRILDETSTEIYIFDAVSFRYLQASAGARRSLGYTMAELARLTPVDLLPELGERGFQALIERARVNRSSQTVAESRQRRKDGSLYPVEIRWQLSHSENPPVFVALVQDITERKRAEAEAQRALELEQQKEAAESANQAKGEFLATMSHEIRTPMNGIIGMTEMLLGTGLTSEQREYAGIVRDSANGLLTSIDAILDRQTLNDASADKKQPAPMAVQDRPGTTADVIEPVAEPVANGNWRVLVAEDNPVNQKLALLQLRKLGYTADPVSSGRAAVTAVETGAYGIVLMDCQMPEMDGFEATAAIRQSERRGAKPRIPIVAMTANAMQGDRDACLAAGMDDYLAKPVNKTQLSALLQRWQPDSEARIPSDTRKRPTDRLELPGVGTAPLDPKALASLRALEPDGAHEFLDNLIDLFMADTPRILEAMRTAVVERDAAGLSRAAHRFRGSSANFGAIHLVGFCEELERLGRAGTTVGAAERLQQVQAEYARVIAALEAERTHVPA